MKYVRALLLCSVVLAMPAIAGVRYHPCYGPRETALAHVMLRVIPYLGASLVQHEHQVKLLRLRTCLTIAKTGRLPKVEHSDEFFENPRNRAIKAVADERHINRLRLLAALADILWPPMRI